MSYRTDKPYFAYAWYLGNGEDIHSEQYDWLFLGCVVDVKVNKPKIGQHSSGTHV